MRVQPRWQISRQANIELMICEGMQNIYVPVALPYLSSHRVNSAPTFVPAATFGQFTEATHGTIANSSNTPTTLNISQQVSRLSQKPRFIGQATSVINMSRVARHFLRVLKVIRSKKNKIQTEFH
jgi:hypothetical protein